VSLFAVYWSFWGTRTHGRELRAEKEERYRTRYADLNLLFARTVFFAFASKVEFSETGSKEIGNGTGHRNFQLTVDTDNIAASMATMGSPTIGGRQEAYGSIPRQENNYVDSWRSLNDQQDDEEESTSVSYDYGHFITGTGSGAPPPGSHGRCGRRQRPHPSLAAPLRSSVRSSVRSLVERSFVLEGVRCSVRDLGGNATVSSEVFGIAKNLVGGGVLSLSGGMAIFSNESLPACLSATAWILILGVLAGYFCLLIAKVCHITKSATYREAWEETVGEEGAMAVAAVNAVKPALGNLAYSAILSQTLSSLFETAGFRVSRFESLILVTVVAILPLCLMKSLNVLRPFSILGTVGIILTGISMTFRYADGSYSPGGKYYDDIAANFQPDFVGDRNYLLSVQVLPFVCMVYEAYVMHYNAPRFYQELRDASVPRFARAVGLGFGLSAAIYVSIAVAGFLTFGGNSDGYILNNYSPRDPLATACRLFVFMSTLLTYPVVFIGFRDGVLDVLNVQPELQTSPNLNMLTVILLAVITLIATFVADLGMINAVGGGTLGAAVVFLFPALMYRWAIVDYLGNRSTEGQRLEVKLVLALMVFGIVLGVAGVVVSLQPTSY